MVVEKGDIVKVEYEGRFENGQIFDSTEKSDKPLEFVVGQGQVIKGFDEAVVGMEKGQEKEITINPENAYGEHRQEMKKEIPRSAVQLEQEPKIGMMLRIGAPDGQQFPATIANVDKETLTLDLNHPLAGKKLIFKVKIIDIKKNR